MMRTEYAAPAAGAIATIADDDCDWRVAGESPNRTRVTAVRFVPVIVTGVPPDTGPVPGEAPETVMMSAGAEIDMLGLGVGVGEAGEGDGVLAADGLGDA